MHADRTLKNTGLSHQHMGEQAIQHGLQFLKGEKKEAGDEKRKKRKN